jgi:predicted secreted Zn-dependent protease
MLEFPSPLRGGIQGGGKPLRRSFIYCLLLAFHLAAPAHAAEWKAKEIVAHYTVTGTTGIALYQSIGANGPEIAGKKRIGGVTGSRRTVAVTEYDLKWRRDYQPKDGGCKLVSAVPILTITYRLPKANAVLPAGVKQNWAAFVAGIEAHERVHGQHLIEMTEAIIAATVGLEVAGDSGCKAIRAEVLARVKAEVATYKARARAFDGEEMAKGGTVERLILALVNGQ